MALSDPIANFLTCIRNAATQKHRYVDIPWSRLTEEVMKLLEKEGFILNYKVRMTGTYGTMRVYLRYTQGVSALKSLKRESTPGCRQYVNVNEIPSVLGGKGLAVLSTSKGILSGREAKRANIGGELLCSIY